MFAVPQSLGERFEGEGGGYKGGESLCHRLPHDVEINDVLQTRLYSVHTLIQAVRSCTRTKISLQLPTVTGHRLQPLTFRRRIVYRALHMSPDDAENEIDYWFDVIWLHFVRTICTGE